jgi:hypothetical protein
MNRISTLILIALVTSGFSIVQQINPAKAASFSGIIYSDTTWTKANSPYELTGPTAVNLGATLTIEPGVIVNFNSYYIRVNGTLRARGTASEPILFNGGLVNITNIANGWIEHLGSGCILEHAYLNMTTISSVVPLKITNSYSNAPITVSPSSLITHNQLTGDTTIGAQTTFTHNTLIGRLFTTNTVLISNNNITGQVETGSSTITNNTITGSVTITNPVSVTSVITNNALRGGGTVWEFVLLYPIPRSPRYPRSVLNVARGTAEISNNTIISQDLTDQTYGMDMPESIYDGGYAITTQGDCYANIHDNTISGGFVRGINIVGPGIVRDNSITENLGGIAIGKNVYEYGMTISQGDVTIRENTLANSEVGIGGLVINGYFGQVDYENTPKPRTVTIQNNLITDSANGIDMILPSASLNIKNNTITNSSTAITLNSIASATINFNNIQNYTHGSINLTSTTADINATYNWWGTTNMIAINQSIRDFKNDFNLGIVSFVPFLNEENPVIPEFPSALIMMLIIPLLAGALYFKKKLLKTVFRNAFPKIP